MLKWIKDCIYKYRVKHINKEYLKNDKVKRKYLLSILRFIKVEDLLPKENKYLVIESLFNDIEEYNVFLKDLFLTDLTMSPLSKRLLNTNSRNIYFLDFFVHNNKQIDSEYHLTTFIETYIKLNDVISHYDISSEGYMFFNFKVLEHYLSNMEDILISVVTSVNIN